MSSADPTQSPTLQLNTTAMWIFRYLTLIQSSVFSLVSIFYIRRKTSSGELSSYFNFDYIITIQILLLGMSGFPIFFSQSFVADNPNPNHSRTDNPIDSGLCLATGFMYLACESSVFWVTVAFIWELYHRIKSKGTVDYTKKRRWIILGAILFAFAIVQPHIYINQGLQPCGIGGVFYYNCTCSTSGGEWAYAGLSVIPSIIAALIILTLYGMIMTIFSRRTDNSHQVDSIKNFLRPAAIGIVLLTLDTVTGLGELFIPPELKSVGVSYAIFGYNMVVFFVPNIDFYYIRRFIIFQTRASVGNSELSSVSGHRDVPLMSLRNSSGMRAQRINQTQSAPQPRFPQIQSRISQRY